MERVYKTINRIIEKLLIGIFALLVLDVLWQVFYRNILNRSSSFTEELARFAMIWLAILGAAYLNGQRAHLAMDFLLRKLPEAKKRRRLIIIECLMLLFAFFVLVLGGINLVYITTHLGQVSSALNLPLGVVYAIVPFSGMLIIFYSVYHILNLKK